MKPGASQGPGAVAEAVERHGRNLQEVNDRLKDLMSTLEAKKARLAEVWAAGVETPASGRPAASAPASAPAANPPPRTAPAPAAAPRDAEEVEVRRLTEALGSARQALAAAAATQARLEARLEALEVERRQHGDELAAANELAGDLIYRYAALEQIHGAPDLEALLQALQELVINVVGSEEFGVVELREDGLHLARAFGLPPGALADLRLGHGTIGSAVATGRTWVAGRGEAGDDDRLTVVVPLLAGQRALGAIAIYGLLGHKPGLTPADFAILELLSQHGGSALALRPPRSA